MNKTNQNSLPLREGWGGSEGWAGLICILGPSGSGKDTAARMLSQLMDIPVLVSFTTRPKREGEKQGREHYFVQSCNARKNDLLAYTQYGGYEYWTTFSQIQGNSAIYVIDEVGLKSLQTKFPDIRIVSIYVSASRTVRRQRGVTEKRMQRDDLREQFPLDFYDYRIYNNKGMEHLRGKLRYIAENLKENGKIK